jgi:hypothetical protein
MVEANVKIARESRRENWVSRAPAYFFSGCFCGTTMTLTLASIS